jgi:hypothetical protein
MRQQNWQCTVFIVSVAALVLFGGCSGVQGPATEPVTGTVSMDGKPIEGAQVVFVPSGSGRAASGTTDASGKFKLTTFNPNDGAVVGKYSVTIAKVEGGGAPAVSLEGLSEEEATKKAMEAHYKSDAAKNFGNPRAKDATKDLVPAKYKNEKDSGLTAEVKSGQENNFEFKLSET